MRPSARIAALAGLLPLAGCGGTTRIVPVEEGRYQMTVYATPVVVGSATQLVGRAWKEAGDLCAQQGKTLQPVPSPDTNPSHVDRSAYAQMEFRCVAPEPSK